MDERRNGSVAGWLVAVLAIVMRAPRSYTREDLVELHTISSPPALSALSERLLAGGARLAGPGEFTRRAYLNGRIDLSQAEAVVRVIEAADDGELRLAQRKLRGGLSRRVEAWRERLTDLLAEVEAGIDFVEQGIEIISPVEVARRAGALEAEIAHYQEICEHEHAEEVEGEWRCKDCDLRKTTAVPEPEPEPEPKAEAAPAESPPEPEAAPPAEAAQDKPAES